MDLLVGDLPEADLLAVALAMIADQEKTDLRTEVLAMTADHGNAEQLLEDDGVSPHTAHTTNLVPLILTAPGVSLENGELSDLAPTILGLLGFEKPVQMSGRNVVAHGQ